MAEFNTPYELAAERAERQAMWEAILRASRAAYHQEMAYREQVMLEALMLSHPSTQMTQVYISGRPPGEDSWGVASVWPQPGVPSGDAGGSRNMGGAGVDPAPDSPGVHGDHRGDEARRPAAAPRRRVITRKGHFVDPERLSGWKPGPLRGASFIGAWADEAEEWKGRACDES